jgi:hypothetical protein
MAKAIRDAEIEAMEYDRKHDRRSSSNGVLGKMESFVGRLETGRANMSKGLGSFQRMARAIAPPERYGRASMGFGGGNNLMGLNVGVNSNNLGMINNLGMGGGSPPQPKKPKVRPPLPSMGGFNTNVAMMNQMLGSGFGSAPKIQKRKRRRK